MEYPRMHSKKGWIFDLRGCTFGFLTAIEPTEKRNRGDVVWRCRCQCGNLAEVTAVKLMRGHTTSCGCLNKEILKHVNQCVDGTNLRMALTENVKSTRAVSGYTGIVPKRGKWQAAITYKKVHYCLGTFERLEDAIAARTIAKQKVMEDAAKLLAEYKEQHGEEAMPRRVQMVSEG